jgi:hypothetical protein
MFALDGRPPAGEVLSIQRLAGERLDLAAQAGAEAVARQAREFDRFDDGAVARLEVLRARRLSRRDEDEDEGEQ